MRALSTPDSLVHKPSTMRSRTVWPACAGDGGVLSACASPDINPGRRWMGQTVAPAFGSLRSPPARRLDQVFTPDSQPSAIAAATNTEEQIPNRMPMVSAKAK